MTLSQAKTLFSKSWTEFNADNAPRLGAALAYYTILSLAPLLILLIAVAGLVFGKEAAQGQLFGQIRDLVGAQGAEAIEAIVRAASKPSSGIAASIIGFLTLLFGASSVANELRSSLNAIWHTTNTGGGVKAMMKDRSKALAVVLAGGFLLLVSLVLTSAIAAAGEFVSHLLPLPEIVLQLLNFLVGLIVISGVFAVLFKYLPDVHLEWDDVMFGALFTSVLFSAGKFLIGLYLGKASFGSTYGAAGSLVIVLVWVYYSAQIFFFGAESTKVYARDFGSDPQTPAPKPAEPEYAATVAQPATGAVGTVGSLLGGALAISKLVNAFRRR